MHLTCRFTVQIADQTAKLNWAALLGKKCVACRYAFSEVVAPTTKASSTSIITLSQVDSSWQVQINRLQGILELIKLLGWWYWSYVQYPLDYLWYDKAYHTSAISVSCKLPYCICILSPNPCNLHPTQQPATIWSQFSILKMPRFTIFFYLLVPLVTIYYSWCSTLECINIAKLRLIFRVHLYQTHILHISAYTRE